MPDVTRLKANTPLVLIADLLPSLARPATRIVESPLAFARLVRANLMHPRDHDGLEQRRADGFRARRRAAPRKDGHPQCPLLVPPSVIRSTHAMPIAERMKIVWISV